MVNDMNHPDLIQSEENYWDCCFFHKRTRVSDDDVFEQVRVRHVDFGSTGTLVH